VEEPLKLWRALFYCMWMSDKTLVQQDLALRMALMLRRLPAPAQPPFASAFFATMRREWLGLDRYRVDKFLSLIRRVVFELFFVCWGTAGREGAATRAALLGALTLTVCEPPLGVQLHVCRVFVEELACATGGRACGGGRGGEDALLAELLEPLLAALRGSRDRTLLEAVAQGALREALLPALEEARGGPGGGRVPPPPPPPPPPPRAPMKGLTAEELREPHGAELAVLVSDREARAAAKAAAFGGLNVATLAARVFAVGAGKDTAGEGAREWAYGLHKDFAALALRCGDAAREEDTFPALSGGGGGGGGFACAVSAAAPAAPTSKGAKKGEKRKVAFEGAAWDGGGASDVEKKGTAARGADAAAPPPTAPQPSKKGKKAAPKSV
jgi:hypothetical protein